MLGKNQTAYEELCSGRMLHDVTNEALNSVLVRIQ